MNATIVLVGFLRNFECATRESNSPFLIGGMLLFILIALIFARSKSYDRYMTGVCFFTAAGVGLTLGAATLALVKDVCAAPT